MEQHAVSAEIDPEAQAREVEPSAAMTAEGYDEAVRERPPFMAEPDILAGNSADPVAVTEADPMSADELLLQGAGRDLRPDTITPAPDISSAEAAVIESSGATFDDENRAIEDDGLAAADESPVEDDSPLSPEADFASEASAPETQTSSAPMPESEGEPAPVENAADSEKPTDASGSE